MIWQVLTRSFICFTFGQLDLKLHDLAGFDTILTPGPRYFINNIMIGIDQKKFNISILLSEYIHTTYSFDILDIWKKALKSIYIYSNFQGLFPIGIRSPKPPDPCDFTRIWPPRPIFHMFYVRPTWPETTQKLHDLAGFEPCCLWLTILTKTQWSPNPAWMWYIIDV